MSNKMIIKIGLLILFLFFDIGFTLHFSQYSTANKMVAILSYLITVLILFSIIREYIKRRSDTLRQQQHMQELITNIRSGIIPTLDRCSLILRNNESAYSEIQAYFSETQNQVVGNEHSSKHVIRRVTRNLLVHSGTSGNRIIYKNITQTYSGNFIITNQRVVFLNSQKGFEIPYQSLAAVRSMKNTLILHSGIRSYTLFMNTPVICEELIHALAKR